MRISGILIYCSWISRSNMLGIWNPEKLFAFLFSLIVIILNDAIIDDEHTLVFFFKEKKAWNLKIKKIIITRTICARESRKDPWERPVGTWAHAVPLLKGSSLCSARWEERDCLKLFHLINVTGNQSLFSIVQREHLWTSHEEKTCSHLDSRESEPSWISEWRWNLVMCLKLPWSPGNVTVR